MNPITIIVMICKRSLLVIDRPLQLLHLVDGLESFNHMQVGDQHFFRDVTLV